MPALRLTFKSEYDSDVLVMFFAICDLVILGIISPFNRSDPLHIQCKYMCMSNPFPSRYQDMGSVLMVSKPMMDQLTQNVADVLLGHMTTDAITTTSLQDEQLIETLSPYKSKIRINFYDVQTKVGIFTFSSV